MGSMVETPRTSRRECGKRKGEVNEVKTSMGWRESGKGKGEVSNLEAPRTSWCESSKAKGEANGARRKVKRMERHWCG